MPTLRRADIPTALYTLLTGDLLAEIAFGKPATVKPQATRVPVGASFVYDIPAHALCILRLTPR